MDDFVVDGQLAPAVIDHHDAHAATAVGEGLVELHPQVVLVDDGQALADVAGLGHGHDASIIANVQHAIRLEHRTQHVLDDDAGRGVRREARLLTQLLREQVDAQIAVLACLRRGRDADHLARTTLEDDDVSDSDVVARDRDGVAGAAAVDVADRLLHPVPVANGTTFAPFLLNDDLLAVMFVAGMEGVENTIGGLFETMADRVVMSFVVVVTHFAVVLVVPVVVVDTFLTTIDLDIVVIL